jgi:hypothetical protein
MTRPYPVTQFGKKVFGVVKEGRNPPLNSSWQMLQLLAPVHAHPLFRA